MGSKTAIMWKRRYRRHHGPNHFQTTVYRLRKHRPSSNHSLRSNSSLSQCNLMQYPRRQHKRCRQTCGLYGSRRLASPSANVNLRNHSSYSSREYRFLKRLLLYVRCPISEKHGR
ncbi:hypothetical protein ESCO_003624 [Escovopsis weberi]|uniref:Uncharacterized protein n=1 Tax=Escovopsis weberi TaxID=150374 RepID=A0A0M9VXI6_ESCWE|nr:hypothetical protein ESCO_003624 [Escovopsis weberi]